MFPCYIGSGRPYYGHLLHVALLQKRKADRGLTTTHLQLLWPLWLSAALTVLPVLLPATISISFSLHQLHPTKHWALINHLQPFPFTHSQPSHCLCWGSPRQYSLKAKKFRCSKPAWANKTRNCLPCCWNTSSLMHNCHQSTDVAGWWLRLRCKSPGRSAKGTASEI